MVRRLLFAALLAALSAGAAGAPLPAAAPAGLTAPVLALSEAERAWVAQHPVIRFQMSRESPPFEYEEQGEFKGMAYQYLQEACRRLGLKAEVSPLRWTEALRSVQSDRRVDLLLCVSYSPDRARRMLFTRPYLSFPQPIFAKRGHDFISGIADLAHARISVEQDYLMEGWLRRDLPEARLLVTDGPRAALKVLAEGQVDAYVGNLATSSFLIDQMGLVNVGVAAPSGYENEEFCFGIRQDWPELRALLDKAIASMSPDDERAIRDPWMKVRYEYGLRPLDIIKWALLVALVAGAFILQLRLMVKRRTAELKAEVGLREAKERDLEQALRAQRELHRQLSEIIDLLPDATAVIDEHRRVVAWNRAMVKLTGVAARDMIGKGDYAYSVPFYGRAQPSLADLLFDKTLVPAKEYESMQRDGNVLSVQVFVPALNQGQGAYLFATAAPLTDATGRVVGAIESIRDITEQQREAEERSQAQRLQAIGTLAGGIAHDFNNILAAILGNTELALSRKPGPELKGDLEVVLKASKRAADLVKQILAFSRTSPEPARPVALKAVAEEALKLLRASIPAGIRLESELHSEAKVLADPSDIHRLVLNLCTNAAYAMGEKGGTLTVRLQDLAWEEAAARHKGLRPGAYVCLCVKDTGVGMDAEVQSHLFEPFFSTRKQEGGSGMGLAVVHGLVTGLGGGIHVESAPGQGSTFQVLLPVAAHEVPAAAPAPGEAVPGTARVLFVDDEPLIVDVSRRALGALGYQVDGRTDPLDALRAFEAAPQAYDLLVTDLTMPGLNGRQLIARARALRPGLPVVLCTGFNEGWDQPGGAGNAAEFLQKPASLAELTQAMQRALRA